MNLSLHHKAQNHIFSFQSQSIHALATKTTSSVNSISFHPCQKERGGFLVFLDLKSPLLLFCLLGYGFSLSIKWFLSSVYLIFLMSLLPTYCGMWLIVSLLIGFCAGDSNRSLALMKQRSHIKSFVSMLHHT